MFKALPSWIIDNSVNLKKAKPRIHFGILKGVLRTAETL
jgi:hypothetical protein